MRNVLIAILTIVLLGAMVWLFAKDNIKKMLSDKKEIDENKDKQDKDKQGDNNKPKEPPKEPPKPKEDELKEVACAEVVAYRFILKTDDVVARMQGVEPENRRNGAIEKAKNIFDKYVKTKADGVWWGEANGNINFWVAKRIGISIEYGFKLIQFPFKKECFDKLPS